MKKAGGKGGRPGMAKPRVPKATVAANTRLQAQTRKLLGKHYANKYRTGRG